ncbi:Toxin co-regulated pilus biosynthesis protein Q [Burkholderia cepacia]|uniref:toxin co-regulated pilus biosynthesis Q family protein n=1 Tax=Burkholderia cepacia TaxID=292 RepID=UPI0008BCE07E|nr:toxin co-regulated pilus biosynthesis Q family protein [Burkholderia cepacia]SEU40343.1 Toxin co-regulated pilus biosynthesis protein Q [Burkholderia cepacia]
MHNTKIVIVMAAFGIGIACAPSAQAGFVNEAAQQQQQLAAAGPAPEVASSPLIEAPAAPSSGRKVTQVGMRPSKVSVPRGKGTDIALGDMAPVVVPREFRLDFGSVDTQQLVAWNGGKPWDAVLTDAITPLGNVEATIDWKQRVVTFRRVASTVSMIAANGNANDVSAKPAVPLAVAMRWEVRASDVTLRQTLIRWAKDAGWQVSWEIGYDYPVQLEGSFTGSFENAVDQFMGSLRYSDYPALACMYEANHVVRVLHYGDKKECDK